MARLIELGMNNDFQPLIHDMLKTLSILLVVEVMLYWFNKDPLMDKIFTRLTLYNLAGIIIYYLFIDKVIGAGPTCCHLEMRKDSANANANANANSNANANANANSK